VLEIRIEACRLAVTAVSRDVPLEQRKDEIIALAMVFETLITRAATAADTDQPEDSYPRIGDVH